MEKVMKKQLMTPEQVEIIKKKVELVAETYSTTEIKVLIGLNEVYELTYLPMALLLKKDQYFVEEVCIMLSTHENEIVRGNAILTFGHIARLYNRMLNADIFDIVCGALRDKSRYVRGQASCAADDLGDFVGWEFEKAGDGEGTGS